MEIESVQGYLSLVNRLQKQYLYIVPPEGNNPLFKPQMFPPKFIFRGHSNHEKYKLSPSIFRWRQASNGSFVSEFSQLEYTILFDFMSEACGFIKDIPPQNVVAWLEIARHYGVPTRLLDFTRNPLVALYFACVSSPKNDASVWIVNETAYKRVFFGINEWFPVSPAPSDAIVSKIVYDEIVTQDYQLHNDPQNYYQYPWIYKPFYRDDRMNAQSSVFMLWGGDRAELTSFMKPEFFMVDQDTKDNAATGILCSVQIHSNKKQEILRQLDACGINEKFIYPGLDGIGRYIAEKYSSDIAI